MTRTYLKKSGNLQVNDCVEGERIETMIERITELNEPIKDGAPLIYTNRKEGVIPEYDIRTDRWEVAIDGMDIVTKTNLAIRENYIQELDGEPESANATE